MNAIQTDTGPVECPLKIGFVCIATPKIIKEVCNKACPFCNRIYNNPRDGFCKCLEYHANDEHVRTGNRVIA